jgi:lipoyl-dependent peroxiredoxin subunit C
MRRCAEAYDCLRIGGFANARRRVAVRAARSGGYTAAMKTVGQPFPPFRLPAAVSLTSGQHFQDVAHDGYPGKWLVVFAWPLDFTFVCPTEIAAFGARNAAFAERGAQVLGLSCDSEYAHLAWRQSHPDLRDLPFPMLADRKRELCAALGILHEHEGIPVRATFVVDPQGVIRYAAAHDLDVGRSVDEVLRTLDALQTGAMCPAGWRQGQPTLSAP